MWTDRDDSAPFGRNPFQRGTSFTDVPAGAYYADAVAWSSANSIMGGCGGGRFGPADSITREQLAATMYRYARHKGYDTTITGNIAAFSDGGTVSSYAVDAANWAIGAGLFTGVGDNMFAPTSGSTRAQAATILMRFCENTASQDSVPEDKIYTKTPDESHIKEGTYELDGEHTDGLYVDNQIVVAAKNDVKHSQIDELVKHYGGTIIGQIGAVGYYQIEFAGSMTGMELSEIARNVSNSTLVESEVALYFFDDKSTPMNNRPFQPSELVLTIDDYKGGNTYFKAGQSIRVGDNGEPVDVVKLTLPQGRFRMTFFAPGYDKKTIEFDVVSSKEQVGVYMTPTDENLAAANPNQGNYTLKIHFTDSSTGKTIPLAELFTPASDGTGYNGTSISLKDGNDPSFLIKDYLNQANTVKQDGLYIEGNEIIFTGLKASDSYAVSIDGWSRTYALLGYDYPFCVPAAADGSGEPASSKETEVVGTISLNKEYLIVGDKTVTWENASDILGDGTASYNFTTRTLTLRNANISAKQPVRYYGNQKFNVVIPSGTTTKLLYSEILGTVVYGYAGICISGGGSLATGSNATFGGIVYEGAQQSWAANNDYGIYSPEPVSINDISLTLGNANYAIASDKTVSLTNCVVDSYGFRPKTIFYTKGSSGNVNINNCVITNSYAKQYSEIVRTDGTALLQIHRLPAAARRA